MAKIFKSENDKRRWQIETDAKMQALEQSGWQSAFFRLPKIAGVRIVQANLSKNAYRLWIYLSSLFPFSDREYEMPTQLELSRRLRISLRSVIRAVAELSDHELWEFRIERWKGRNLCGSPNLAVEPEPKPEPKPEPEPEPKPEPKPEPEPEPKPEPKPEPEPKTKAQKADYQALVDIYNQCKPTLWRRCQVLTSKRESMLRTTLKRLQKNKVDNIAQTIADALHWAESDEWWSGRVPQKKARQGGQSWNPFDFETLLRQDRILTWASEFAPQDRENSIVKSNQPTTESMMAFLSMADH